MTSYTLIGIMSGTSMDGVDLAHCSYEKSAEKWDFELLHAETFSYPDHLLEQLAVAKELSGYELTRLDKQIAEYFAECVIAFAKAHDIHLKQLDAIASHGHTIFHQPSLGITLQIGCGATLSKLTGVPVINDFRKKDILHGGQGAPLVPIGDLHLFRRYASAFLNIGGFTNICLASPSIHAFDISPGNLPLNLLAGRCGQHYDKNGELARSGKLIPTLLATLNQLDFYGQTGPKSLGTEWLDSVFVPLLTSDLKTEDLLRTCVEHIADQIAAILNHSQVGSVLITGGGAKNTFLIERIAAKYPGKINCPEDKLIDFKEAIIFGFLGALFLAKEVNCLSSVTGAEKDVCGGVLHLP